MSLAAITKLLKANNAELHKLVALQEQLLAELKKITEAVVIPDEPEPVGIKIVPGEPTTH